MFSNLLFMKMSRLILYIEQNWGYKANEFLVYINHPWIHVVTWQLVMTIFEGSVTPGCGAWISAGVLARLP
jgi:hypothetical protein